MNNLHETGKILNDRYKILSVLGQGGMSNVYLVEDLKLNSHWALKEMLDTYSDEEKEGILAQFRKEASMLAGMKHSNLPRVFDYFEESSRHYLVMEYILGMTLEDVLERDGVIPPEKVTHWAIQLCEVLEYLHSHGIVYRDMKPGNIMLNDENKLFIVDFGIARLFSGGKIHDTLIIGTPGFASPEHFGRSQTDSRSDIYSLGVTLHYLLTNIHPSTVPFVFKNPSDLNHEIPRPLSDAILKAVALDPVERFQSVAEMNEFLVNRVVPAFEKKNERKAEAEVKAGVRINGVDVVSASKEQYAKETVPIRQAPGTVPLDQKQFSTNPVPSYVASAALSGGTVFTAAILITGGIAAIPFLWTTVAAVPLTFLYREFMKYINRSPAVLKVKLDEESINLVRGQINLTVGWKEVTGLLIFQEKSRIGTYVTKFKLFTEKGNFEYSGEMSDLEKLNDYIIQFAGLSLQGESGEYKRYGKSKF